MKLYYNQHAKDHSFRVGHKVWIYDPAVKPGLSKKLCCLWHGPFCLIEKITPVSFKVANLQGKLQKDSIHVNRMKQCFTYDDPPTDSSPHNNSNKPSPSPTFCPQALVTEPPSTENTQLADIILSHDSRNTTPDPVEDLQELNPLPDLMNSTQKKINGFQAINEDYQLDTTALPSCVTIHNEDHQLDINTLPDCVTPARDHALSDHVITRGKQTVARSGEINNFADNHDQKKKIINHNLPTDACQTPATDNNIYLVEQVKNHRHRNGKLQFLFKCLSYSNRHNTWEPENHVYPALVREYFQHSSLEKSTPINAVKKF